MKRKLAKETTKQLKKLNVKETINSGAFFADGDGIRVFNHQMAWGMWGGYCMEAKFTEAKSFRLTKDILDKINKEALRKSYMPAVLVGMIDKNKHNDGFVVLRQEDFIVLIDWMEYLWNKDKEDEKISS